MNEELIQHGMKLFDSSAKWLAFRELMSREREIQSKWWNKLQSEVYKRWMENNKDSEWVCFLEGLWNISWVIREEETSLCIWCNGNGFLIHHGGSLDNEKIKKLLSDSKFDVIFSEFNGIDERWNEKTNDIVKEERNYSFGTPFDGNFPNHETLSWFAGNKTEEFANQILEKVKKLQTPEITELFKEINKHCKLE